MCPEAKKLGGKMIGKPSGWGERRVWFMTKQTGGSDKGKNDRIF